MLTPEPKVVQRRGRCAVLCAIAVSVLTPEPKVVQPAHSPVRAAPVARFQCSPLSRRSCNHGSSGGGAGATVVSVLTPEPKVVQPHGAHGCRCGAMEVSVLTPEPKVVQHNGFAGWDFYIPVSVLTPEPKVVQPVRLRVRCGVDVVTFQCSPLSRRSCNPAALAPRFRLARSFQCSPLSRRSCNADGNMASKMASRVSVLTPEPKVVQQYAAFLFFSLYWVSVLTPEPKVVQPCGS